MIDCLHFNYDYNISKIDLHRLSVKQIKELDETVCKQLDKQLEHLLIKPYITKERKDYTYTYNQIKPWEVKLYDYIDKILIT